MVADHHRSRLSGNGRSFTQTERKQTVSVRQGLRNIPSTNGGRKGAAGYEDDKTDR